MRGCWWVVLALIVLSFITNIVLLSRPQPQPEVVVQHDTAWRDTTIYKPVPVDSHKTGEIVYIRVSYPVAAPGDTITIHDSIDVPIPIEQKRYEDTLYTAWVSGYRPALDSILIHQREITTTITKTIVKPAPRLSVGIQTGAGVGLLQHRPDIYLGVGIQYRLWPK